MKTKHFLPLAALLVLLFSSCSYYYSASVQGFVQDSEDESPINEASIYFFTESQGDTVPTEASVLETDSYFLATPTIDNNGGGYYQAPLIWDNPTGRFGVEGDVFTLYTLVYHPDYAPVEVAHRGILSDNTNTLLPIKLTKTIRVHEGLVGRIVNESTGDGLNGVRVRIKYESGSTPENKDDFDASAQSIETDEGSGYFEFGNIEWRDTETQDIYIWVDDANFQTVNDSIARDWENPFTLNIEASEFTEDISTDFSVTRIDTENFSTVLNGRIFKLVGTENRDLGIEGITVQVKYSYTFDGATSDIIRYDETNNEGRYSIDIDWKGEVNAGSDIPEGEDAIFIDIVFDPNETSSYDFSSNNETDFQVITGKPNSYVVEDPATL